MTGRTYGYARVSTTDQDLTIQREALAKAGCDMIREEKASGTSLAGRTELQTLLDFMREGDTLVITRIDRLARSMLDLQIVVKGLQARGIALKALEQPIDTSTASGKAFLDMLGVFAEFETNLRKERQSEGIAKAKQSGKYTGGKRRFDPAVIRNLSSQGKSVSAIAREIGCKSRTTIYRALEEQEISHND